MVIRFFFNFILFGLLFYAIYYFFPTTFSTLVGWIGVLFDWIRILIMRLVEMIQHATSSSPSPTPSPEPSPTDTPKALFQLLSSLFIIR